MTREDMVPDRIDEIARPATVPCGYADFDSVDGSDGSDRGGDGLGGTGE